MCLIFLKASHSKTAVYMPKSVGASLHPCLTPLLHSRDWVISPSTISLACTSVYSFLMILINFGGQPSLRRMMKRSSQLTVSNALTKSTKAMYKHLRCSLVFSISWRSVKIPSIVLLPLRYSDCNWGYMDSTNRCSLCKMTSANTFPTALSSDMPL